MIEVVVEAHRQRRPRRRGALPGSSRRAIRWYGSHKTLCWREPDSNPRSRFRTHRLGAASHLRYPSPLPLHRRTESLSTTGGPRVRSMLPPRGSDELRNLPRNAGERSGRQACCGGREALRQLMGMESKSTSAAAIRNVTAEQFAEAPLAAGDRAGRMISPGPFLVRLPSGYQAAEARSRHRPGRFLRQFCRCRPGAQSFR